MTGWPPAWLKLPLRGRTGRRGTDCSDGTAESIGQSLNQRRFMHACSVTDMWIHVQTYRTLVGEKKSRHSRDVCYLDWDWIHLTGQIPREFSQRRLSFTDKTQDTSDSSGIGHALLLLPFPLSTPRDNILPICPFPAISWR